MTVTTPNTTPQFSAGHTGYLTYPNDTGYSYAGVTVLADGSMLLPYGLGIFKRKADGTPDLSFNGNGGVTFHLNPNAPYFGSVFNTTQLSNGKILVAGIVDGSVATQTGNAGVVLMMLNANGTLDTGFGGGKGSVITNIDPTASLYMKGAVVLPNGKILVATNDQQLNSQGGWSSGDNHHINLSRFLADGTLDQTFGTLGQVADLGSDLNINSMTVQGDGKILVSAFISDNTHAKGNKMALLRLNADGSRDTGFGTNGQIGSPVPEVQYGSSGVSQSVVQADGKIIVVGNATTSEPGLHNATLVARYNSDGTLDTSFASGGVFLHLFTSGAAVTPYTSSSAGYVHVNDDGSIVVIGAAGDYPNSYVQMFRLRADGTIDKTFGVNGESTFNAGPDLTLTLENVSFTADGHILLVTDTIPSKTGGSPLPGVVEFTANGMPVSGFGNAATGSANSASYHQGYAEQFLNPGISIRDAELAPSSSSGNYAGASVTLSRDGGANASDQFGAGGALTFRDGKAYVSGIDIGTVTNAGGTLRIAFGDHATQALVNTALESISYQTSAAFTDGQHVKINWVFSDGNNGTQGTGGALSAQFATDVTLHTADAPYWIDALLHRSDTGQTAQQVRAALITALGTSHGLNLAFASDGSAAAYSAADKLVIQKLVDSVSGIVNLPSLPDGAKLTVHNTLDLAAGTGAASQIDADGGDVYFSFGTAGSSANTAANAGVLLADLELALGLAHPATGAGLPVSDDHVNLTLLSSGAATVAGNGALGVLDIAALQYVYGPNPSARAGNDTYALSTTSTNFIWDGAGTDTISAAGMTANLTLHLAPGYWDYLGSKGNSITSAGQITINYGSVIENASGGNGNDNITGTDSANTLQGGAGNDVLTGLGGDDLLDGGAGLDTAVYRGARASYVITATANGYTVKSLSDGDGTDTLVNIERIQFSDTIVKFNSKPDGQVALVGTFANHQVLTAVSTLTDLDGMGTLAYQWYRDGNLISGARDSSYLLSKVDLGKAISVTVGYVDGEGTAESVSSASSALIAAANAPVTGTVTVTGTAAQGQTLSLANNLADLDDIGTFSYQWYADGVAIPGAKANMFLLTESQVGKLMSASISYVDGAGYAESVSGAQLLQVANVNDKPAGQVVIDGKAAMGSVLTVSHTLSDPDGMGTVSYQWYAGGAAIDGQHGASLALTGLQLGKTITVRASYIDGHGTAEMVASQATQPVSYVNSPGSLSAAGDMTAGHALSVTVSDADGVGQVDYLWQSFSGDGVWVAIPGASGNTLALTEALTHQQIRVAAAYTDALGMAERVTGIWAPASASHVNGTAASDALKGGDGNDVLTGGAGDDWLDGGAGLNTANYAGASANYQIVRTATGLTVTDTTGAEGSDTLSNILRLHFSDKDIAFDIDGTGGQAYRLYQAAFNRVPDSAGLGYWIAMLDKGASGQSVADAFIHSTEFQTLYGGQAGNRAIVNSLYENVLHRTPDAAGLNYWAGVLDSHAGTLDQVLAAFSESAENQQALAQVIGKGIAYIPFGG